MRNNKNKPKVKHDVRWDVIDEQMSDDECRWVGVAN